MKNRTGHHDIESVATTVYQASQQYLQNYFANPSEWPERHDGLGNSAAKKNDNGREIIIKNDIKNSIITVTIMGNDEDKKNGLTGTDGKAVIKYLGHDSYDHIKTEDNLDKGLLLFNSSREIIENMNVSVTNKKELLDWLAQEETRYNENIIRTCNIDRDQMQGPNAESYFLKINQDIKVLQQQSLVNIASALDEFNTPKSRKARINEIKRAEKKYIQNKGRPFVIKIKEINNQNIVSMQMPLGEETIPSSLRSGKDSEKVKLSNHVRDGSGIIDKNGNISLKRIVDGHSSYPPISERDELLRRKVAIQAAEEKVRELVKIAPNKDPNIPINISMSTMMLLTPFVNKAIDETTRRGQSERNQLSDTRYALDYLQNTKPLEIKLDGITYKVNVETTYMNIPVNVGKKTQKILQDEVQININSQGFNKYCENVEKKLLVLKNELPSNQSYNSHDSVFMKDLIKDLYLLNRDRMVNDKLVIAKMELKEYIEKNQGKLSELHSRLKYTLTEYELAKKEGDQNLIDEYKRQYNDIKNQIAVIQSNIDQKSENVNIARKSIYKDQNKFIDMCLNNISHALENINLDPKTREYLELQSRYLKAESLYLNDGYQNKRNLYQFQVLFLITSEDAGQKIEAFCKSAEDRTGWLRVSLLTNMAFNNIYHRDPDLNNPKDKKIYDDIASTAYELSASLENTKYNSEARGLQVKNTLTHATVLFGNLNAHLAKSIYDKSVLTQQPTHKLKSVPTSEIESSINDLIKYQQSLGKGMTSSIRINIIQNVLKNLEKPLTNAATTTTNVEIIKGEQVKYSTSTKAAKSPIESEIENIKQQIKEVQKGIEVAKSQGHHATTISGIIKKAIGEETTLVTKLQVLESALCNRLIRMEHIQHENISAKKFTEHTHTINSLISLFNADKKVIKELMGKESPNSELIAKLDKALSNIESAMDDLKLASKESDHDKRQKVIDSAHSKYNNYKAIMDGIALEQSKKLTKAASLQQPNDEHLTRK